MIDLRYFPAAFWLLSIDGFVKSQDFDFCSLLHIETTSPEILLLCFLRPYKYWILRFICNLVLVIWNFNFNGKGDISR